MTGEAIESGSFCRVVLAVDHRGRIPCQKEFFASHQVGDNDKKKLLGRLRTIARYGYPASAEQYRRFGDVHYIKIHGFRALGFERDCGRRRELVVCVIIPKRKDRALDDAAFSRARTLFAHHCERFPAR